MNALAAHAGAMAAYAVFLAPLAGALAAFVIPSFRIGWIVACATAFLAAASGVTLAILGASVAPFGVRFDALACAGAPIVAIAGALCVVAGGKLAPEEAGVRAAPSALAL